MVRPLSIVAFVVALTLAGQWSPSNGGETDFPVLKGEYLGQSPPGAVPEMFAPGVVSKHFDELNAVFSPQGDLFLFSVKLPNRSRHTMMFMSRDSQIWTPPEVLPFSGGYSDADPAFDREGKRVFFISMRPLPGEDEPRGDWDLWVVDRDGDAWGEPIHLGPGINSKAIDVYPSLADDGTLYFSSGRDGGFGKNDLYKAEPVEGGYGAPENLGTPINTEHSEGDLYVSPDESFIVFVSSGRPDAVGRGDLYVSRRMSDGSWSAGINLGEGVNSDQTEYCPAVSRDGKYLFFTSYRNYIKIQPYRPLAYSDIQRIYLEPANGLADIYWVDAGVLNPESQ
jgi:hypothetical protein